MDGGEVSLHDVARAAGVSPATASRALNGRPGVRDDVRTRVTLVADGLGYRPHRAAQNLAGGRTSILGLVLASDELVDDPYAAALVQSVARAANRADEGLMLILDSANPSRTVRNLASDGLVDGVIISAQAAGNRWVEELLDARIPTVLAGSHPERTDVTAVGVENLESSAQVVGMLLDGGCRRVATITGPLDRREARQRLEGYRRAHAERGLVPEPALQVEGDFTYPSGLRASERLLDEELGIDAVFAANDQMALAFLQRTRERGIDVPGTISVAGFDGIASGPLPEGLTLTTVRQPLDELAERAVESVLALVTGQQVPREHLLPAQLVLGTTTRTAAAD